jgi:hypothetical protein
MSEGEAFVNPMAAYLVQGGRGGPRSNQPELGRRRHGIFVTRSLLAILAAVAASAIVAFTVARGVGAVSHNAKAQTVTGGRTTSGPDPPTMLVEKVASRSLRASVRWPHSIVGTA